MIAKAKQLPELKKRVATPALLKHQPSKLGFLGEQLATNFLKKRDYLIIDTNVRYKHHELDIVAIDTRHKEWVFVEVKTRSSADWGSGSSAVTTHKLRGMELVARVFLQSQLQRNPHLPEDYRFDIICVTDKRIEHFENISWNF